MKIRPIIKLIALILLVITMAFNMSGCGSSSGREGESDSGSDTGNGGTTTTKNPAGDVTISTINKTLTADGAAHTTLTAVVTDKNGKVIDGEKIIFTITSGSGRFTEADSGAMSYTATSSAGLATAEFYASTNEGAVTVTATAENKVAGTIYLTLAKGQITLEVEDSELIADGVSTSVIRATLVGPDGKRITDTVSVDFVIIGGTGGLPYSNESKWNNTTGGIATATYRASETPGMVTIQASAIGYQTVTTEILLTASRIILNAVPAQILADGVTTSTIYAWVTDARGTGVTGETVDFTIISGGGGLPVTTLWRDTTDQGSVQVEYKAPLTSGTAVIEARTTSGASARVQITLIKEAIGSVALSSGAASIEADGITTTTVTATIKTLSGANPPPGTPVTFMTNRGSFPGGGSVVTPNDSGVVTISLLSSTAPGTAEVSCMVAGITQKITVEFTQEGSTAPAAVIQITATPASIEIDGESSVIRATVTTANGDAIASGTPITFSTDLGSLSRTSATAGSDGSAQTQLTSGNVPGIATVTATASGVTSRVRVTFTSDTDPIGNDPAFITLSATPNPVRAGETTQVVANILDGAGVAVVKGVSATFSIGDGSFSRFPNDSTTYTAETLDGSGRIILSLRAGSAQANEVLTCEVETSSQNTISQSYNIVVEGETSVNPAILSLGISASTIKTDNSDSSTITATVLDENRVPVKGVAVTFSTSAEQPDGTFAPAGMLSASAVTTNDNGIATVTFSSGDADRRNQIVNISAQVNRNNGDPLVQTVPIRINGTTMTLTIDTTNLEITDNPDDHSEISDFTVTVKDAGGNDVHAALVNFVFLDAATRQPFQPYDPNDPNNLANSPIHITDLAGNLINSGVTSLGTFHAKLVGNRQADVIFQVESLGFRLEEPVFVGDSTNVFRIVYPLSEDAPHNYVVGQELNGQPFRVTVRSPQGYDVRLAASFGQWFTDQNYTTPVNNPMPPGTPGDFRTWVSGNSYVLNQGTYYNGRAYRALVNNPASTPTTPSSEWALVTLPPNYFSVTNAIPMGGASEVSVYFSALQAGRATIQAYDLPPNSADTSRDQITVYVTAGNPSQISLQASATVVRPSLGGEQNKVTLTATVRNVDDQIVGDAGVVFSILNPTGGGEYVTPVVALTNQYGVAVAEFYSGTLSTDSQGVLVSASLVDNAAISSQISIKIGQTPGSVHLSTSTVITDDTTKTFYKLAAAVLVLDSNGNPVSGANVTLSSWPVGYYRGVWVPCSGGCCISHTTLLPYQNEDINKNLILDAGEDIDNDGELTPINSAAASVPASVVTGSDGTATFDLVYLKSSAGWIEEQLTATAVVFGTESTTNYEFTLPWMVGQECNLSDSPYNPTGSGSGYTVTATAEPTTISAGGQSTIRAMVLDPSGNRYTTQVMLSFVSRCTDNGTSTIDATALTVNGVATAIYRAQGCAGTDTITVTTEPIAGSTYETTVDVEILPPEIGAIQFNSATPASIALRGTGGAGRLETSQVQFTVRDTTGNPAPNIAVTFWLVTDAGGATVTPTWDGADKNPGTTTTSALTSTVLSNQDGVVTAQVRSGYCPGDIRVIATIVDISTTNNNNGTLGTITTGSDMLVASTGLPDQDSFSLSMEIHNPEGLSYDGETVPVTIFAADHDNNPVPDKTAIYFTTEGGSIVPSCETKDGGCTVLWNSQDPRPPDGIVTILATSVGEEHFADLDANCRFTAGDTFGDLPEAFRDDNENGIFDPATESYVDFNNNSLYDNINFLYNGSRCASGPCTTDLIHVRQSQVLIMSGSVATIRFIDPTAPGPWPNNRLTVVDLTTATGVAIQNVQVVVMDENGNSMPNGTTINITTSNGRLLSTRTSFTVPDTYYPWTQTFVMGRESPLNTQNTGIFEVTVSTRKGIVTISSISIIDDL